MNCINFKIRQKNYKKIFYCAFLKKEIQYADCSFCKSKEYKKNKPIKKVGKNRITVSDKTYNTVFEKCQGRCVLCGTTLNLHYHHILYRSERKDLIDDPINGIMLCVEHHELVHSNKKKYQPLLLELRRKIEDEYTRKNKNL